MILYEEAQGGRVTGDLSTLLEAVGAAVQNLVQVSIYLLVWISNILKYWKSFLLETIMIDLVT